MSQHLAALERDLKVRLVERSAAGVKVTAAGEALYGRAQVILRQIDDLRADVRSPTNRISGPIAIGLPPSVAEMLTLPLLEAVCRDHPELRPQVLEEGSPFLEDLLAKGGVEVAVLARRADHAGVEAEKLLSEPLMLVAPAAWDLSDRPTLEEMSRLPWVTTRRTHSVRVLVEAVFAQAGLEHRVWPRSIRCRPSCGASSRVWAPRSCPPAWRGTLARMAPSASCRSATRRSCGPCSSAGAAPPARASGRAISGPDPPPGRRRQAIRDSYTR
jgi:DNA-binding transcriptional LysR family regulator